MGNGEDNCYLLWITPNINNDENKEYQKKIKREFNNIKFYPFSDVNKCLDQLKKIEFKKNFCFSKRLIIK